MRQDNPPRSARTCNMELLKVKSVLCLFAFLFILAENSIEGTLPEKSRNHLNPALQACSSDSQCGTANEYCDTEEGLCSCKTGFYRDKNLLQCLAYKECSSDSECGEEEYCSPFGVCDCRPKYFKRNLTSGMCEAVECWQDYGCNKISEYCDDDEALCDCRSGFYRDINSNKCKAYRYCNSTKDCKENEYCNSQGVCDCVDGSYRHNKTKQCTTYTCSSNQRCGDNQYCNPNGLCACKTGFYRDQTTLECTAYKKCSDNSNCSFLEYCNSNGLCACLLGYFRNKDTQKCVDSNKRCTEGCGANEYCNTGRQTHMFKMYGKCLCKSGYYKHRDTRECVAHKKCSSHDECNANEYCNSNSVCDCKSGFHREEDTGKCIAYKHCNNNNSDCGIFQFCNSEGVCDCQIGYHWGKDMLEDTYRCFSDKYGTCDDNNEYFDAENILCYCKVGYYRDKDTLKCLAYKHCSRNEDCNPDEHCISGDVCDCNEGYYRHKDNFQCLPLGVCSGDSQCKNGQRCNGKGLCECKTGFQLDNDTMKCNEVFSWPPISPPHHNIPPNNYPIAVWVTTGVVTLVGITIAIVYIVIRSKARNQQQHDRIQGLT